MLFSHLSMPVTKQPSDIGDAGCSEAPSVLGTLMTEGSAIQTVGIEESMIGSPVSAEANNLV